MTIASPQSGATLRYTLNGTEPTLADPAIASGGTLLIHRHLTLKVKAWLAGVPSTVTTGDFRITGDLAAGASHTLALDPHGAVVSWGEQLAGRLGNGFATTANLPSPAPAKYGSSSEIGDAVAIGAGLTHSVFVREDGTVWTFGSNSDGQLGDNTSANSPFAVQVMAGTTPGDFLPGCRLAYAGNNFSVAIDANGQVFSWGTQVGGRLGNGATLGTRRHAVTARRGDLAGQPALEGIAPAALGAGFVLARESHALESPAGTGGVWSWGHNTGGQLGHGHTNNRAYAYPVMLDATTPLTDAWHVSAGEAHSAVVRWNLADPDLLGSVWTFGSRGSGRLGNGSTANGSIVYPVRVVDALGVPIDGITMVAAGACHTLALDEDGTVWAWGYNGFGAVGDGTTTNRGHAVKVKKPDGTGELGLPVNPGDPKKIIRIAAGGDGSSNTSFAIDLDGRIYGWGRNDDGELGNGTVTTLATPLPVVVPGFQVLPGFPEVGLAHALVTGTDPGEVILTATPSDPDGAGDIAKVEFYSQGMLAGQATAPPWTCTLAGLESGNYHVFAVVTDAAGHLGQSAPLAFEIELDPDADEDGDGLTNGEEATLGTDPRDADTDGDGMEDGYEQWHTFSPLVIEVGIKGPAGDFDGDGMSNLNEHHQGRTARLRSESYILDPANPGPDGMIARWFGKSTFWYTLEYSEDLVNWTTLPMGFMGQNEELSVDVEAWYGEPMPVRLFVRLNWGPAETEDIDGDGLSAAEEFAAGTDPTKADSDNDGLFDGWEIANGLDPNDGSEGTNGGSGDADGDGLTNLFEQEHQSDPNDSNDFPVVIGSVSGAANAATSSASGVAPNGTLKKRDWDEPFGWTSTEALATDATPGMLSSALIGMTFPETLEDALSDAPDSVTMDAAATYASAYFYRFAAGPTDGRNGDSSATRCWVRAPAKDEEQQLPFIKATTRQKTGDNPENQVNSLVAAELVMVTIPENETDSGLIDLRPETIAEQGFENSDLMQLLRFEVAPEVLAVNSDFDEGRIDPVTGYAIPDCDDDAIALEAVRNHLDGKFSINQRITDDMHKGWFGVRPGLIDDEALVGAEITIRKIDKEDPDTGHPESGQVRFYVKWGEGASQYRAITPYDFTTLQPVNLVTGGLHNAPGESVYGPNRTPAVEYYMEGVHPGKITLEWKLKKGEEIEITHQQSFEIYTRKTAIQWRHDLEYKIRLETLNDPSGEIWVEELPLPGEGYAKRMERITEYYDFYRECFHEPLRSNPSGLPHALSWPGLARLAGSQVIGGLSDSEYGKMALQVSQIATPPGTPIGHILDNITGWTGIEIDHLQQALFNGGREIFTSVGWMHHAYRSSGYRAIEYVATVTGNPDAVALAGRWKDLHQGVLDHDVVLINEATLRITDREQNITIVPTWTTISSLGAGLVDDMFSILGKNSCTPAGLDFVDVFPAIPGSPFPIPSGSLANTVDRWHWIDASTTGGILHTWNSLPMSGRLALSGDFLASDAKRFSIFANLPVLSFMPILSWDDLDVP